MKIASPSRSAMAEQGAASTVAKASVFAKASLDEMADKPEGRLAAANEIAGKITSGAP